jgi:hypothetical protein
MAEPLGQVSQLTDPAPRPNASFAHQRWTTPMHVARWFGVAGRTVSRWIVAGHLRAHPTWHRHYTDDRSRKTSRGRWRIYESDLRAFVARARGGTIPVRLGVGPGFWKSGDDE